MATYTDKQLEQATQIAYAKLGDAYKSLVQHSDGKSTVFTIEELKNEAIRLNPNIKLDNLNCLSEEQVRTWSIAAVRDTNNDTGFYGCVIDTGDGNAIVAYRGSEGMGTDASGIANLQHDWVEADLGILNSDGENKTTNQYQEAKAFLSDESFQNTIKQYNKVTLTGHSLGGNLAAFSMIVAEECGIGQNFERCVSFDGPGFSDEFIEHYKDDIAKQASKIDHYKWSFVGSILHPLPGENGKFIKVTPESISNFLSGGFTRHSTSSIDFTEDGYVQEGKQDFIALVTEKFTRLCDALPAPIGNTLSGIIGSGLLFGFEHKEITITTLVLFAISHPAVTTNVIGFALVVLTVEYVGEHFEGWITSVVDYACNAFNNAKNWTKEKIADFCNGVKQTVTGIVDWYKSNFDQAYKDAQNYLSCNTVIRLHTDDLHNLAERLWALNGRLERLDQRLDNLYKQVKWTDLWNLMRADFKIGWSPKINSCANCLNDTANRFETVEQQLLGMMG